MLAIVKVEHSNFKIMVSTADAVTVRIPKRVDYAIAPHIIDDLDKKMDKGDTVVLDFSQTRFIKPEMADIFLDAVVKAKQRNVRLALQGVKPDVKVILELGGVLEYFRRR